MFEITIKVWRFFSETYIFKKCLLLLIVYLELHMIALDTKFFSQVKNFSALLCKYKYRE